MRLDLDILALDLAPIAYKVCRDEGWSVERVDDVELQYRAYLQLVRDHPRSEELAPSREVDIFWHHHLLDSRKYEIDCQALFGGFLHHYPYSGVFSEADKQSQRLRVERSMALIHELCTKEKLT